MGAIGEERRCPLLVCESYQRTVDLKSSCSVLLHYISVLFHHLKSVSVCYGSAEEVHVDIKNFLSHLSPPQISPSAQVFDISDQTAVAARVYSSFLYSEIQFPQDL